MNRSPSRPYLQTGIYTLCSVLLLATFGFVAFVKAADPHKIQVQSEAQLRNVIQEINAGAYAAYEKVEIVLTGPITLSQNLNEIKVPSSSRTEFVFTSTSGITLNGNGYQGFVVSTNEDSPVSFVNLRFSNCIAQGAAVLVGDGTAGLGGAIYVKSGDVSLLDVQFTNNKAVGGNGSLEGGLGAGGAVFVESEGTLSIQYSENFNASTAFSNNQAQGGQGSEGANGDGIGNALFAGGNITFNTATSGGDPKTITIGSTQSIGGPVGSVTDFSNFTEEELAEIKKNAGGVSIIEGGTLILQSENTHLGKTEVDGSTLIVQNGKAIHDQAEVSLINGGILELGANETIGYLSGSADSEVRLLGKTLTIGGDEYAFGGPGNGLTVLGEKIEAFDGIIVTNHQNSQLVKTGTGLLILGGDNRNENNFMTTLQGGTIQLNNANALGEGMLTVTSTDTELGRNMLQTGLESLTLENNIKISTQTPFRVGVAEELADNNDVVLDLAGQITGTSFSSTGSIMMNMGNKNQVLTLSNYGTGTQANQLSQVQLNVGTLALTGEQTETKWATGLGSATIVALEGSGKQTALRIDTQGLVVDNNITVNSSGLTITNGDDVTDFTLAGKISGSGGLIIDLNNTTDTIHFGGQLLNGGTVYQGVTDLRKGTLQLDEFSKTIQFSGGLAFSEEAVLNLNGNTVSFNGTGTYDLNGTITGEGELIKAGTGTWNLNLQNTMNQLTVNAGTVNLKNGTSVDHITIKTTGTLKLENNAQLQSLSGSTGGKLNLNDQTLTLAGTGETYSGELLGGSGSKIILENGRPENKAFDWQLSGASQSWTGIIDVQEGAILRVSGVGALGKFLNTDNPGDVGSVILNHSTLSIGTTNGTTGLGRLEINGEGTIETISNLGELYLYDIQGTGDLVKTGKGSLYLIGENSNFEGDVQLKDGYVILNEKTTLGTGKLISGGSAEDQRGIVVYANKDASSRELSNEMSLEQDLTVYYSGVPDLTLSGDIDGEKRLNLLAHEGSGNIVLTGNYDDYSGIISIGNGTTMQLGSVAGAGSVHLAHSTVSVYTGATFNASGTINAIQVANGGTLELTSTAGRLQITDQLTLGAGSILSIDCMGGQAANGGLITIDGAGAKAVLGGGLVVVNASDIQIGDTFTLIDTANGGLLEVNMLFSFKTNVTGSRVVGSYDATNQRYTYEFVAFDYLEEMQTKNQLKLGGYLNYVADNFVLTPQESETFSELQSIIAADPELGRELVDELTGQVYASMGTAQIQGTSMLNQSLATQLRPGAFAGNTWDGTGRSYYGQQAFADRGLSAWLSGYGMIGTIDPDGTASGYDLDIYGGLLGLERCSNNLSRRLGFYYGYGQTKLDTKSNLGKGTSDDNRLGLYAKWDDRFGYGLMSGGVGFNSYKFDRFVTMDEEWRRQNVRGVQTSFYGERGTSLRSRFGILQPFVGIQYIYQHQGGFDEEADVFALNSNGVFTNSLRTMVGGRFIKAAWRGQQSVQWYLQGHWMHEYLDQNATMTAAFTTPPGPGFEVSGNNPGSDWLVAGTGIQWNLNARTSITGSYDAQINDRTLLHVGAVGAKIVW